MSSENNKRIAKNTMLLYIRMFITMAVSLYTSRVVLNTLGVEDFGIYNIVGSLIVAFAFISGPLGTATQRFYNFELGKKNLIGVNSIYNHSLIIYLILAAIMFVLTGIGGYWFIEHKMILPIERMDSAKWAFFACLLSFVVGLLKTPYEALIIAHERMNFYAYMTIIDVVLKLAFVFSLVAVPWDKLIFYAFGLLAIGIFYNICVFIYSHKQFSYIRIQKMWDKETFRSLMSFSGWTLFGSMATMAQSQGLMIILNLFFGIVVNAAMGIAEQVSGAINHFVSNFQIAFRPQLVKRYANDDRESLTLLIYNSSKYSYILIIAIACPFIFNMNYILELWLSHVPKYASEFCVCMMIYAMTSSLAAPMWITIQATGKIKKYEVVISTVILCSVLLSYLLLAIGLPPITVFIVKCVMDIIYLAIRLFFLKKLISFQILDYINKVLCPLIILTIITFSFVGYVSISINSGIVKLCLSFVINSLVLLPLILFMIMNQSERQSFFLFIKSKIIIFKQ